MKNNKPLKVTVEIPEGIVEHCKSKGIKTDKGIKDIYSSFIEHVMEQFDDEEDFFIGWADMGDGADLFEETEDETDD